MTLWNTRWYTYLVPQIIARVPKEVADGLNELVESGLFETKSDAVREALVRLIDRVRRDEIGRRIVEGYRRMPQTDEEFAGADEAARRMIEEEPW